MRVSHCIFYYPSVAFTVAVIFLPPLMYESRRFPRHAQQGPSLTVWANSLLDADTGAHHHEN